MDGWESKGGQTRKLDDQVKCNNESTVFWWWFIIFSILLLRLVVRRRRHHKCKGGTEVGQGGYGNKPRGVPPVRLLFGAGVLHCPLLHVRP